MESWAKESKKRSSKNRKRQENGFFHGGSTDTQIWPHETDVRFQVCKTDVRFQVCKSMNTCGNWLQQPSEMNTWIGQTSTSTSREVYNLTFLRSWKTATKSHLSPVVKYITPKHMGFPSGSAVKNLPAIQKPQETQVRSLGGEDPLEKEMATHSSILPWRILWREEPGGL